MHNVWLIGLLSCYDMPTVCTIEHVTTGVFRIELSAIP